MYFFFSSSSIHSSLVPFYVDSSERFLTQLPQFWYSGIPSFNAFDRMAKDTSRRAGQMILRRLNPRYIGLVTVRVMLQQDMEAYCAEVLFSFLFSFLRLLYSSIRVALKYPLPSALPITRKFHVAYNILASQKELCGLSRSIVRHLSV